MGENAPNYILKEEVMYFKNMFVFQAPPSPLTETNCMDFFTNNNVKINICRERLI